VGEVDDDEGSSVGSVVENDVYDLPDISVLLSGPNSPVSAPPNPFAEDTCGSTGSGRSGGGSSGSPALPVRVGSSTFKSTALVLEKPSPYCSRQTHRIPGTGHHNHQQQQQQQPGEQQQQGSGDVGQKESKESKELVGMLLKKGALPHYNDKRLAKNLRHLDLVESFRQVEGPGPGSPANSVAAFWGAHNFGSAASGLLDSRVTPTFPEGRDVAWPALRHAMLQGAASCALT
jgi:hypothetical protein